MVELLEWVMFPKSGTYAHGLVTVCHKFDVYPFLFYMDLQNQDSFPRLCSDYIGAGTTEEPKSKITASSVPPVYDFCPSKMAHST